MGIKRFSGSKNTSTYEMLGEYEEFVSSLEETVGKIDIVLLPSLREKLLSKKEGTLYSVLVNYIEKEEDDYIKRRMLDDLSNQIKYTYDINGITNNIKSAFKELAFIIRKLPETLESFEKNDY